MAKLRRFRVPDLSGLKPGDTLALPRDQARHAAVLRLESGSVVELFDETGRSAAARLERHAGAEHTEYLAHVDSLSAGALKPARLVLAVGWPKGKRAAVLVEKCTELGVDAIIPVRFSRGVVHKSDESEGLARLRRIAAEAAKQCGRSDTPQILPEMELGQILAGDASGVFPVLLDPAGPATLPDIILKADKRREKGVLLIVGPEGGLDAAELENAARLSIPRARMGRHVMRVETAALAACAITRALLDY